MAGYIARAEKFQRYQADLMLQVEEGVITEDEYNGSIDLFWKQFRSTMAIAAKMQKIHQEEMEKVGLINNDKKPGTYNPEKEQWFAVTIRPKDELTVPYNQNTFQEFKKDFEEKILPRTFVKECDYVFEQKGTSEEELGNKFHMHAIIKAPSRSKGNVARDITSSLKKWVGNAGVQVDVSYNAKEWIKRYCKEHKSADGHKEVTAEWDDKWRNKIGIEDYYEYNKEPPKPSPLGGVEKFFNNIVEW